MSFSEFTREKTEGDQHDTAGESVCRSLTMKKDIGWETTGELQMQGSRGGNGTLRQSVLPRRILWTL